MLHHYVICCGEIAVAGVSARYPNEQETIATLWKSRRIDGTVFMRSAIYVIFTFRRRWGYRVQERTTINGAPRRLRRSNELRETKSATGKWSCGSVE